MTEITRTLPTALIALSLLIAPPSFATGLDRTSALGDVRSWTYQLQKLDIDRLSKSDSDLAVIDHATASGNGLRVLDRSEVEKLKRRPDGSRRIVLAYLSIGEAETYRFYWQKAWLDERPEWLWAENCRWPENYLVRFWQDGWKDIIYRGAQSYLARIQAAGFDGVYLDRIDVFSDLEGDRAEHRANMIRFVSELGQTARAADPNFLVVAQNAEDLLSDARYRAAIDGLAKEDLITGVKGTGKRNPREMIDGSLGEIAKLQNDGKPVFAVEYLASPAAREETRVELARLSILPTFPSRALDGSDPVDDADGGGRVYGTPEYAAKNCNGVFKKADGG